MSTISAANDFFIGTNGAELAALLPIRITTREQAFRTAAWIALMGETLPSEIDDGDRVLFEDVRKAVMST